MNTQVYSGTVTKRDATLIHVTPMDSNAERLMTVEEAAEYLRLAEGTIKNRVSDGTIPYLKAGGLVRFRRSELDAWMESHREPANTTPAGEAA